MLGNPELQHQFRDSLTDVKESVFGLTVTLELFNFSLFRLMSLPFASRITGTLSLELVGTKSTRGIVTFPNLFSKVISTSFLVHKPLKMVWSSEISLNDFSIGPEGVGTSPNMVFGQKNSTISGLSEFFPIFNCFYTFPP